MTPQEARQRRRSGGFSCPFVRHMTSLSEISVLCISRKSLIKSTKMPKMILCIQVYFLAFFTFLQATALTGRHSIANPFVWHEGVEALRFLWRLHTKKAPIAQCRAGLACVRFAHHHSIYSEVFCCLLTPSSFNMASKRSADACDSASRASAATARCSACWSRCWKPLSRS